MRTIIDFYNLEPHKDCHIDVCEPGCQCQGGKVFQEGKCVEPNECPCVHGGRSFTVGQTLDTECESCVCQTGGTFECEYKPCWHSCSVFGDPHFTTFDKKQYEFQGNCKYIFSRTKANSKENQFLVTIESIPCGSSGKVRKSN